MYTLHLYQTDNPLALMTSYNPKKVELSGREAVMSQNYTEGTVHGKDFYDLIFDENYDESVHDPVELLGTPPANLVHERADPEFLDLLKETEQAEGRERYIIRMNSTPQSLRKDTREYLEESEFFQVVNPIEARETIKDKYQTHEFLKRETDIPTIPTMDAVEALEYGEDYTQEHIGDTGEGYVVKSANTGKGTAVHRIHDWERFEKFADRLSLDKNNHNYIIQPFIEHDEDHRWQVFGTEATGGEIRRSEGSDFRTNISVKDVQGTDWKARYVLENGFAEPITPDSQVSMILAEDTAEEFADKYATMEPANIAMGVDVMMADRDAVEGLPDSYLDSIERYAYDDKAPIITEANDPTGQAIDRLHIWDGTPEHAPVVQEAVFLQELAGVDTPEPEEIAGDIEDRIWARVRTNFRSRELMNASVNKKIHNMMKPKRTAVDGFSGP